MSEYHHTHFKRGNNHFRLDWANHPHDGRSQSEDALLIDLDTGLFGVFDSVGGRDQGLLVSHRAEKTIASAWQSLPEAERQGPPTHLEAVLQEVIRQADTTIAAIVLPPEQKRPATTAALGVLSTQQDNASLSIAHVGDSHIYLLRAGNSLQRLTEDHGYFPFAVRRKMLSREESLRIEQAEYAADLSKEDLLHFERRNKITCAVGWTDFSTVQTQSLTLVSGDRILFCTDGVHDNLTDREIEELLKDAEECHAKHLISAAYHRSQQTHLRAKHDDMSAIVVEYL